MIDALKGMLRRPVYSTMARFLRMYRQVDPLAAQVAALDRLAARMIGTLEALQREINAAREEQRALTEEQRTLVQTNRQQIEQTQFQARILRQQLTTVLTHIGQPADGAERGQNYYHGLRTVGVLNYENPVISGEHHFLTHFLKQFPAAVVFDVGANIGEYSKMVREHAPQAVIHAFEPHPASFAALQRAASTTGIIPHQIALGDTQGEIELFDYADEAGSQHASVFRQVIEEVHRRPAESCKVRMETLDAITAELGISRIGLLKIDTEGNDLAVLKGARKLLDAGAIDVIQFEFNSMNVISRVFMRDFFALLPGYRLHRLLPDDAIEFHDYDPVFMEVFAFQNIVCIRRDIDPAWIHAP